MKILVFNCGSSSLKYRLVDMPGQVELAAGEAQRVGPPTALPSRIIHNVAGRPQTVVVPMPDHASAFVEVMKLLETDPRLLPDAVGHRMVHGGTLFAGSALVDDAVLDGLDKVKHMAPLHNPPATRLIHAIRRRKPHLPQVVVFDTAYHADIPPHACDYALPRRLAAGNNFRKFGFHGTSHRFVVQEAAKFLGLPLDEINAVSCHLGSGGASVCATVRGRSVDNTMGYSPLQGLVMSTRCGDLDPAVTLRLLTRSMGDPEPVEKMLNQRSGVLGLSSVSADIRDILTGAHNSEERLQTTAQVYLWRIRKYVGSYLAVVGHPHALVFTDTIGETVPLVRWSVCTNLEPFGVHVDYERNLRATSLPADVAADGSPVRILVVATNEELAIARESFVVLSQADTGVSK